VKRVSKLRPLHGELGSRPFGSGGSSQNTLAVVPHHLVIRWQTWATMSKSGVSLTAGQQVVCIVMDARGASGSVANFNWLEVR